MYGSRIIPLNAGDIISYLSDDAHLLLGYMKLWQNASVKTKSICAFRILAKLLRIPKHATDCMLLGARNTSGFVMPRIKYFVMSLNHCCVGNFMHLRSRSAVTELS